jgi:FKBP-type peptidyl-prolyl cis-trans isomerase
MKQFLNVAVICAIALAACTTPFKKAKDGTQYKVISLTKGPQLVTGNYMEMNVVTKLTGKGKDSIMGSSVEDGMPQYGLYDTANFPPPYKEIFKSIHVGDSIFLKISTDSILAKAPAGQAPPFIKKGMFICQSYTITNVYTTKEQVDSAQKTHIKVARQKSAAKAIVQIKKILEENKDQLAKDDKAIADYLAKNNIKATKTEWGTYIAVQNEGTGDQLTSADIAMVNYTGKSFDSSKVFDSNTDPAFGHVQPYTVNLAMLEPGQGVILGWDDALLHMKKGTKATVYIPSTLGYGKSGNGPKIKGDAILVFDMEVVDVSTEEKMMAKQAEEQKKQMEAQQKAMDSLQKAAAQPKK